MTMATKQHLGNEVFQFRGKIRAETPKAWAIAPCDYYLPGPATAWFPKNLTQIVGFGDGIGA